MAGSAAKAKTNVRVKSFVLFTDGPGGTISNQSVRYPRLLPWKVCVRARGIRQAYGLLARQVAATSDSAIGVTEIDRHGSLDSYRWPWRIRVWPELLGTRLRPQGLMHGSAP